MRDYVSEADDKFYFEAFGSEEELTPCNFYIPSEAEYIDFGEEEEEISVADAVDYTKSDKTGACWEGYERVPNTKEGAERKVLEPKLPTSTKTQKLVRFMSTRGKAYTKKTVEL